MAFIIQENRLILFLLLLILVGDLLCVDNRYIYIDNIRPVGNRPLSNRPLS